MSQQNEGPSPAYSKHDVHEVWTTHGLVAIIDARTGLTIKVHHDGGTACAETEYVDRSEADDYCSHDPDEIWETGREEGEANTSLVVDALEDWHGEHHEGVARFCCEEPCEAVQLALRM